MIGQTGQATPEVKPPETKPPEAKPPEPAAEPLKAADIVVPEGFEVVDDATKEAFVGILNEYKIPKEGMQKLVDLQTSLMKAASERGSALWTTTQDTWRREIMADAEFGGPKLTENLGQISRLIDRFAPGEQNKVVRDMMDLTGAGNHPAMIKFLTRIARETVEEGRPVSGTPPAAGRTHAEILFPNQGKT